LVDSGYGYLRTGRVESLWPVGILAAYLFQFRPLSLDLPFDQIQGVSFGSVVVMFWEVEILCIRVDEKTIQLGLSRVMPPETKSWLVSAISRRVRKTALVEFQDA
jgi:hypothetical protein